MSGLGTWFWQVSGGAQALVRLRAHFARLLGRRAGDALPITLDQKKLYVLPTGFGVFLATILFVSVFGSLNYNNNLALAFAFLFCALGFLSVHIGHRNLLRLRLLSLRALPCHAPNLLHVECQFDFADQRPRTCLEASFEDSAAVEFELDESSMVTLVVPSVRRGWFEMPPLTVSTRWPFGLFVIWSHLWPRQRALIYPALEPKPPPLPSDAEARAGAQVHAGEEDLRFLRDYQYGDATRQIAWKASARRETLLSREFETPQAANVVLSFDSLGQLPFESRISRLAAWCEQAEREQLNYALKLPGASLPLSRGPAHLHACLKALALLT